MSHFWWEEGQTAHQLAQVDSLHAERETQELYGFLPDLKTLIHLNAHHVLGDTSPDVYFTPFTNKTFHDLTPGKSLPLATAFWLGFCLKFFLVPKKPLWFYEIEEGINCFDHDINLKIQFAEKLWVKSTRNPDHPSAPILHVYPILSDNC